MLKWLGQLVDSNEKQIKKLDKQVEKINALEPQFQALTDDELRAKTGEFKERLYQGASLDDILPEAFAAVREAARRTIGQRHYDVQLIGGMVLHQGRISEMKTGEGKTLVATLPLYLNSLTGRGCHLVTVNDYLARRDPYWMGPVYSALGVTVACIYPQQNPAERQPARIYDPEFDSGDSHWPHFRTVSRQDAYRADITYGTSSEFGFDYLRDNMVIDLKQCVQRELNYSIVDEVDNLLIDEARTPLIISGPAAESSQRYQLFARLVPRLVKEDDYTIDEKTRNATLTEDGMQKVEAMLRREGALNSDSLYDPGNFALTRYLENALKAHAIFQKDRDYVVKDGEVLIVDEFTGRLMFGRRYSEGLHQAIEAKENVRVQQESMTYATITIQNYFRMYDKLSGMTGTALTESEEFSKIYELDVVVIPTNRPLQREDHPDRIYKDEKGKFRALVNEIAELHKEKKPVLIGTVSIEKSEYLSGLLKHKGIPHEILNAKNHEKEADIIARAGEPGAVTVATNMAGRGVDILLGGKAPSDGNLNDWQKKHDNVLSSGGLHVIGTERHESRRIDNQLRGRAGRQGDPGMSRFYVSLEDDIMRRFGGERIKGVMQWAGLDDDTPIENSMINKAITDVQKRVEGYHFDLRKHLVEYDDVVNKHRELIYGERKKILEGADLKSNILDMLKYEIEKATDEHLKDEHGIEWDIEGLLKEIGTVFPLPETPLIDGKDNLSIKEITERLYEAATEAYDKKENDIGSGDMRILERLVMLKTIDNLWVEHLTAMEYMRQEAGWQTLRQVRAVDAYKNRGYEQFQILLDTIKNDVARSIFRANLVKQPVSTKVSEVAGKAQNTKGSGQPQKPVVGGKKVGRNDPCPCGSGKKYKHCCGR